MKESRVSEPVVEAIQDTSSELIEKPVLEPGWSHILQVVKSTPDVKHCVLKLVNQTSPMEWLELTPASCSYIDGLGPMDVVRLVVSPTMLYQVTPSSALWID